MWGTSQKAKNATNTDKMPIEFACDTKKLQKKYNVFTSTTVQSTINSNIDLKCTFEHIIFCILLKTVKFIISYIHVCTHY